MTEYDEFGSSWTEKKEGPHSEFCIHCSVPFQTNCWNQNDEGQDEDFHNLFVERVSEIPSSSSKIPLSQALSTIFKLNYLKAFTKTTTTTTLIMEQQQQEKLLSLCLNCSQVLTQLYQLYNDFAELGKLDSYLSSQLCQLNQIMDQHQERNIHCDLKERLIVSNEEDYDDQTHQDYSHFDSNDSINLDKEDNSNYSSLGTTTRTTSSTNFDREPRVLLTRLPKKYLHLLPASSSSPREEEEETVFLDSGLSPCDDGDDEDFLPEDIVIKTEIDDDEEFHPMVSITDDNALSSSKKSRRNSKNKSGLSVSGHLSSTATTTAVGIRKSNRIPRKKILEPLDVKIETEKGKGSKRQNVGSKKGRTKKSKNQQSNVHNHNGGPEDGNLSSNDDGDDAKGKKSGRKSQIGIHTIKRKLNKSYYVYRTKYANPCWYCSRTDFPSPTSVVEHTRNEHLSQLSSKKRKAAQICSRCSKICSSFHSLELHLQKCKSFPSGVILPNQYECPQCPKTFAVKYCLRIHMETVHTEERRFKCDQCPYEGKLLWSLTLHKSTVHPVATVEEIPIQCDECPKIVKSKRALKWHKKNIHSAKGSLLYQQMLKRRKEKKPSQTICSDCDNVDFCSRLAYHNHRRSFHGDIIGDFVCELCGRDFARADGLRHHMHGVHSEARPFLCPKCGMAFKNSRHLLRHDTNTHTTEGRLRHNEKSRIEVRRRNLLAKQLAQVRERSTMVVDQGVSWESSGQQQLNDVTPSLL